jgi:hypothetical protein
VADTADSKARYSQDSDTTRGNPRFLPAAAKKQQQRTASHNSQKSSKTAGDNRHPVRMSQPSIPRSRPPQGCAYFTLMTLEYHAIMAIL